MTMAEKKIENKQETGNQPMSQRAELFQKVLSFIPDKVNNKTVMGAFDLMRHQQKLKGSQFDHLEGNAKAFEGHQQTIRKNKGFIENQCDYTNMNYGKSTVQAAGCEIIATYNALVNIHGFPRFDLTELISFYEKDGMILDGRFGTAPSAAVDLLKAKGYQAELETDTSLFDKLGERFESLILTMYNDAQDISKEVHTINISKENGKFTAHNPYCNGMTVGAFSTVSETIANINGGKAKGISLIGITAQPEAVKAAEKVRVMRGGQLESKPTAKPVAKPVASPATAAKPVAKPVASPATTAKPVAKPVAKPTVKK